jgi:hypothetical protein
VPVESDADRAVFVNAAEFGLLLRYKVPGLGAVDIAGVRDMPSRDALAGDVGFSTSASPRILIREIDLPPNAAPGANTPDIVTIDGVRYEPRLAEPDGTGMLTLTLEEAT